MSSNMAFPTERNAIRRFIAHCWVLAPRLEMMNVEPSASFVAVGTCPVISTQNRRAERLVFDRAKVSHARRTRAAFPVRMRRPDKMGVAWRLAARALQSGAYRSPLLSGQNAAPKCFGNIVSLRLRDNASRRGWLANSGCRYFLS